MTFVPHIYKRYTIVLESLMLIPPTVYENIRRQRKRTERRKRRTRAKLIAKQRVVFPSDYERDKILTKSTLLIWFDLVIYSFTSHSRIFHLYGDVTIAGEGLQNLGLCSALGAFEQGGIFIVPHLLWYRASVFPVSSEGSPHSVASYDTLGDVEELF
jgi:hypothetical protein